MLCYVMLRYVVTVIALKQQVPLYCSSTPPGTLSTPLTSKVMLEQETQLSLRDRANTMSVEIW